MAHIVATSERVFAHAGFEGASMTELAAAADLPKANLHYYFRNKEGLYRSVLDSILTIWVSATDDIKPENHPAEALSNYIRTKMEMSKNRPYASKVFANEVLHGATQLRSFLGNDLRKLVKEKAKVIHHWVSQGLMDEIDPAHLLFAIWAMTQTYADFEAQIRPVLGIAKMSDAVYKRGTDVIVKLVLQGCGIRTARDGHRSAGVYSAAAATVADGIGFSPRTQVRSMRR
jgi:TetR/AcrR family transcriptional regulator